MHAIMHAYERRAPHCVSHDAYERRAPHCVSHDAYERSTPCTTLRES